MKVGEKKLLKALNMAVEFVPETENAGGLWKTALLNKAQLVPPPQGQ